MNGDFGGHLRAGLMTSAAIVCVATATPIMAQTRAFNVPEQSAASGVSVFARQADIQLLIAARDARGHRINAVRGNFSVQDGLRQLLAGTGLRAQVTGAQTYSVVPTTAAADAAPAGEQSADAGATPEILVVGSRIQNVDIRRTEDDPQPYVVFDHREIEDSNASNLEDFFRTRLPMNTQQGAANQTNGASNTNISSINLRGLGANQTLILVDGRRAPRVSLQQGGEDFTQADINGIPLSAIERIEILPSTAGGIYGGGAVGGVINIIRKRNYNGIDVRIGYDGTFRGGGEAYRAEVTGGFSPDGGTTQVSFSASQAQSRPLYVDDNDLWRRSRERFLADADRLSQFPPDAFIANTPNIASALAVVSGVVLRPNLVLDNGTPLGSYRTFVPVGYAGPLTDGGAALVANAGHFNLDLSHDGSGALARLLNNPRVRSANLNIRRSFGRSIDAFADLTLSDNLGRSQAVDTVAILSLPASSPANPFQQAINVYLPVPGFNPPVISRSQVLSLSGGLIARLGGNWVASTEYDWSRARSSSSANTGLRSGSTGFTTSLRSGTIAILRDFNQFPIDYTPYLQVGDRSGPFSTLQQVASARASGPIIDLWGGPLTLSTLVEYRNEAAQEARTQNRDVSATILPARSQAVASGYAELRLPLISDRNAMPFVHALEVQASIRYDRYHTRTALSAAVSPPTSPTPDFDYTTSDLHSTNYTVAARWEPVRDLALRASYSTGFLPPSLSQLVSYEIFPEEAFGSDPRRGGQQVNLAVPADELSGGNPDLQPERSRSLSLGAIFTPRFLPGVRLSIDYTRIRKRGEIASLDDQQVLDNEANLPGRVERGPNLPGDPPGWAGPVTSINSTLINIARSSVQALDLQADYAFEAARLGRFRFYVIATRELTFRRQLAPASASVDSVGLYDGPLKWRGNAGIDWSLGNLRVAWNAQYYDSYLTQRSSGTFAILNKLPIPGQLYHDINISYRFGPEFPTILSNTYLSFGVQNIFDRRPPVVETTSVFGYSFYGDPRLRRFTLSIGRHF